MGKLMSTTLQSHKITHSRLKHLAGMAQTSEDHVSRLGMSLSLSMGPVESDWAPTILYEHSEELSSTKEKQMRGKTLFKGELGLWMALVLRSQQPANYDEWRAVLRSHWERGTEELMRRAIEKGDWLRTVASCVA